MLEVLGESPVLHSRPAEAETGCRCREESRSCRICLEPATTKTQPRLGWKSAPAGGPGVYRWPHPISKHLLPHAPFMLPYLCLDMFPFQTSVGVLLPERRDGQLFPRYRESCRQERQPSKQQVASRHPVIKEIVNTAVLAPILAGSLLIHVPDRKLFLHVFEAMCAHAWVHVSIQFHGPILND